VPGTWPPFRVWRNGCSVPKVISGGVEHELDSGSFHESEPIRSDVFGTMPGCATDGSWLERCFQPCGADGKTAQRNALFELVFRSHIECDSREVQ